MFPNEYTPKKNQALYVGEEITSTLEKLAGYKGKEAWGVYARQLSAIESKLREGVTR